MRRPVLYGLEGFVGLAFVCAAASCGGGSSNDVANGPTSSGPDAPLDGGSPDAPPPGADYVIVAADALSASADRFRAYRESTGHQVELGLVSSIIGDTKDAAGATAKIHDWVKSRFDVRDPKKPFFLLIVGDAVTGADVDASHVPVGIFVDPSDNSKVTTDNTYADMDGDGIPDLAVGRLAVASDADVDVVLDKTKRYEATYEVGEWNRRLSLFSSTSGFGEPIDTEIEQLVFSVVEEIPYDFDITLTYAKQTSPYVYVPEKFSDKVYDRMNEGSLLMAYVGHGDVDAFATLQWNGASYPILDTSQISKIDTLHKPPLLTLIACLTGAFGDGDSLSEQILRTKNGPIGILSSTEISHPYANAIFIRELAQSLTVSRDASVGELFVDAKRRMIQNNDPLRQQIDAQVGLLVSPDDRKALKQSHLYMYTLFGDPAARLSYPKATAKVTVASSTVAPGGQVSVSATFAGVAKGNALVTLESTRSQIVGAIAPVPADGTPTRDDVIIANYTTANDRVVAKATVAHEGGTLSGELSVPSTLPAGDYYVKVYADDGAADAAGSVKITVTSP